MPKKLRFSFPAVLGKNSGFGFKNRNSPIDYKLAVLVYKCRQGGSTDVPRWWTLPTSRHWGSTSSVFCLVIVADCPPYVAVNHQWLSFSGRCPSCLEGSSTARHVSTVTSCLLQLPQDSSLQALLPMTLSLCCRVRDVTPSLQTCQSFLLLTYLLTYLLTHRCADVPFNKYYINTNLVLCPRPPVKHYQCSP